jgi:nucleotide-binding universal stress UspA family protein
MQGGFERVVVPVAGTAIDRRALALLPDLVSKDGAIVTFLHVVEVPQSMPLDAELPREIDKGEEALRQAELLARRALPGRSTQLVTELLQARAVGPAIVDEAVERGADAIVMTTSVHRKHGRPTLGETMQHVLLHAPCEVVVIRAVANQGQPTGAPPP